MELDISLLLNSLAGTFHDKNECADFLMTTKDQFLQDMEDVSDLRFDVEENEEFKQIIKDVDAIGSIDSNWLQWALNVYEHKDFMLQYLALLLLRLKTLECKICKISNAGVDTMKELLLSDNILAACMIGFGAVLNLLTKTGVLETFWKEKHTASEQKKKETVKYEVPLPAQKSELTKAETKAIRKKQLELTLLGMSQDLRHALLTHTNDMAKNWRTEFSFDISIWDFATGLVTIIVAEFSQRTLQFVFSRAALIAFLWSFAVRCLTQPSIRTVFAYGLMGCVLMDVFFFEMFIYLNPPTTDGDYRYLVEERSNTNNPMQRFYDKGAEALNKTRYISTMDKHEKQFRTEFLQLFGGLVGFNTVMSGFIGANYVLSFVSASRIPYLYFVRNHSVTSVGSALSAYLKKDNYYEKKLEYEAFATLYDHAPTNLRSRIYKEFVKRTETPLTEGFKGLISLAPFIPIIVVTSVFCAQLGGYFNIDAYVDPNPMNKFEKEKYRPEKLDELRNIMGNNPVYDLLNNAVVALQPQLEAAYTQAMSVFRIPKFENDLDLLKTTLQNNPNQVNDRFVEDLVKRLKEQGLGQEADQLINDAKRQNGLDIANYFNPLVWHMTMIALVPIVAFGVLSLPRYKELQTVKEDLFPALEATFDYFFRPGVDLASAPLKALLGVIATCLTELFRTTETVKSMPKIPLLNSPTLYFSVASFCVAVTLVYHGDMLTTPGSNNEIYRLYTDSIPFMTLYKKALGGYQRLSGETMTLTQWIGKENVLFTIHTSYSVWVTHNVLEFFYLIKRRRAWYSIPATIRATAVRR